MASPRPAALADTDLESELEGLVHRSCQVALVVALEEAPDRRRIDDLRRSARPIGDDRRPGRERFGEDEADASSTAGRTLAPAAGVDAPERLGAATAVEPPRAVGQVDPRPPRIGSREPTTMSSAHRAEGPGAGRRRLWRASRACGDRRGSQRRRRLDDRSAPARRRTGRRRGPAESRPRRATGSCGTAAPPRGSRRCRRRRR